MTREHGEEVADTGNLSELHGALLSTQSVEQFLHEMAVMAARVVERRAVLRDDDAAQREAGHRGVQRPGRRARVDEVQYELDDGPCLHAMRDGTWCASRTPPRRRAGPSSRPQAASHGIRSCLALPLNADGKPVGALNLYSRKASAFGTAEARRAENFAENASGALSLAMRLASHAALIEQLRSSLTSRTVIDQALGIIMAREHCNQARAFAILRSASQNSNVKLRDIASAVVTSITGEPPQPAPPFEEGRP